MKNFFTNRHYLTISILTLLIMLPISLLSAQDVPESIQLELFAEGFTSPIDLEQPDDGSGRMFIVDQTGVIYVINSDGEVLDEPFLDLSNKIVDQMDEFDERGLLGMALHPDFANNGRFFVYYSAPLRDSAPSEWNHTSHLSEFTVSMDNANVANPDSETVLLMVDEPQFNHDAGDITFGPDGFLYVPLGDGGAGNDVAAGHTEGLGNGQDLTKMLGKILRIDVNNGDPYAIPEDNPFVDNENALDEIWAYGFRNPWRISFDDEFGLIVADLGQNVWEEIHIVHGGQNYGWNLMEGTHCFNPDAANHNPLHCEMTDQNGNELQLPIIEYNHQVGVSIIGGYVYRGSALSSDFQGNYFFGDWSTSFNTPQSQVFVAIPPEEDFEANMWSVQTMQIANTGNSFFDQYILSFGEDLAGELYVLTSETSGPTGETGRVWRISPAEDANS